MHTVVQKKPERRKAKAERKGKAGGNRDVAVEPTLALEDMPISYRRQPIAQMRKRKRSANMVHRNSRAEGEIAVRSISKHAAKRKGEKRVSKEAIEAALRHPLNIGPIVIDDNGRKSQKVIGKVATVVINPDTKKMITVWKTGSKTRSKIRSKTGSKTSSETKKRYMEGGV
ncbi:MAG: hypothetical protein NC399_04965 [Muribaculum sp.]|nr:hypothetical protein [Muribaculum sp.]